MSSLIRVINLRYCVRMHSKSAPGNKISTRQGFAAGLLCLGLALQGCSPSDTKNVGQNLQMGSSVEVDDNEISPGELAADEAERARLADEERAARELQEEMDKILSGVIGLSIEDAEEALEAQEIFQREELRKLVEDSQDGRLFKVGLECSPEDPGTVLTARWDSNELPVLILARNAATVPDAHRGLSFTTVPDLFGGSEANVVGMVRAGCYEPVVSSFYTGAMDYKSNLDIGYAFDQSPAAGTVLADNEPVRIWVSKPRVGVRYVENALLGLSGGSSNLRFDDYAFWMPFEKDGKLYVMMSAVSNSAFDWRDEQDKGTGFGTARIVDEFDKEVPLVVLYTTKRVPAGKEQFFTIEVPLTDLQIKRPTKIMSFLSITRAGVQTSFRAEVTLTW